MTTLAERPYSRDELDELIRSHTLFATMRNPNTGEYLVRHAERRREHEIIAVCLQSYSDSVEWMIP